jgi:prepilin-type N-terminal cleavage/methylation domain-containing protein
VKTRTFTKSLQAGFTLVEIAIVLVIIGLLIGGVLKGREMITNAKIKRIENDFAGVSAAIYAYQDRYGVLPGDDPAASTRFAGTWRGADNGNGNGNISGGWSSRNNAAESRKIWKHLRGSGLIAGPVDNTNASYQQPSNSFGGLLGIDLNVYNLSGHNIVFGEIPGDIAQILEARGDDGVPSRGSIQSHRTQITYDITNRYDVAYRQ